MRSEAGGAAFIVLQEARPCFRQAEQPQGVSGRSGVENDVIEAWRVPGEQADELIERGDLRRAGTRKLLPHRRLFGIAGIGRQLLEHASPISVRRGFGIDVHREEPLNLGNRLRRVGEFDAQHLVEIGGGIRADEQHAQAAIRQGDGARAAERGLADAALPREEQEGRGVVQGAEPRHGALSCRNSGTHLQQNCAHRLDREQSDGRHRDCARPAESVSPGFLARDRINNLLRARISITLSAFGRSRPNADNVIGSKSLRHARCEKPVPLFRSML